MTMMIPDGYAELALEMTQSGDPNPYYITFGVNLTGTGLSASQAEEIVALWDTGPGTQQVDTINFTGLRGVIGTSTGHLPIYYPSTGRAGSVAGGGLTQNTAALVHKVTPFPGRGNKGRMYVPGLPEGTVDNIGQLTTTAQSNWQTQLNSFLTNLGGDGVEGVTEMVILHTDSPVGGTTLGPTPVTALVIDRLVATQRRRLRGRS